MNISTEKLAELPVIRTCDVKCTAKWEMSPRDKMLIWSVQDVTDYIMQQIEHINGGYCPDCGRPWKITHPYLNPKTGAHEIGIYCDHIPLNALEGVHCED